MLAIIILLVIVAACCCLCWKRSDSEHHATKTVPEAGVSREREVIRVSGVSAVCNPADGSIEVEWFHPFPSYTVTGYEICYEILFRYDSSRTRKKSTGSWRRSCRLTRTNDGVEPLNTYEINIRPIVLSTNLETEWESTIVYVDWHCHYPGCTKNRRTRDENSISKFCSVAHAEIFNSAYCLFPECALKCRTHFCADHLQEAITKGICGFVKLDSASDEYRKLKSKFSSSWCSEKGRLPKIFYILQIVNPFLKSRFERYVKGLPWRYQIVEQYYHGTQLKCDMLEYYEPCTTGTCGVCGISKTGFDPNRINPNVWQRFGKGFYFAPNSSKSYDYPLSGRQNDSVSENCPYRCLLVCDIAVGCKYTLYRNDPTVKGPPSGYHSIYGKSRWMWLWSSPDLNYDELVVFEASAIRPSYVLFCENTTE